MHTSAHFLNLLHCPRCTQEPIMPLSTAGDDDALVCPNQHRFAVDRGVIDFLGDAHPAVVDERGAVAAIDAGEVSLDAGHDDPAAAFERHVELSRQQLREVLRERPLAAGETLIELGADSCWASELFLDAGCRVIAVDITSHLHLAARADDPDLCRLQADMNRLPIRAHSVDVVWANAAAHHSWDLAATFREAARVLRPGGRLYFCCEPLPSWLRWPLGLGVGAEERRLGIHETWIPRYRWLRLARSAGFEAELMFPKLDEALLQKKLSRRHVPETWAPGLVRMLKPMLPCLQVSIHLLGRRRP